MSVLPHWISIVFQCDPRKPQCCAGTIAEHDSWQWWACCSGVQCLTTSPVTPNPMPESHKAARAMRTTWRWRWWSPCPALWGPTRQAPRGHKSVRTWLNTYLERACTSPSHHMSGGARHVPCTSVYMRPVPVARACGSRCEEAFASTGTSVRRYAPVALKGD